MVGDWSNDPKNGSTVKKTAEPDALIRSARPLRIPRGYVIESSVHESDRLAVNGGGVTAAVKTCKIAEMELTHPVAVASSADTGRRCVGQSAQGGSSECSTIRSVANGPGENVSLMKDLTLNQRPQARLHVLNSVLEDQLPVAQAANVPGGE